MTPSAVSFRVLGCLVVLLVSSCNAAPRSTVLEAMLDTLKNIEDLLRTTPDATSPIIVTPTVIRAGLPSGKSPRSRGVVVRVGNYEEDITREVQNVVPRGSRSSGNNNLNSNANNNANKNDQRSRYKARKRDRTVDKANAKEDGDSDANRPSRGSSKKNSGSDQSGRSPKSQRVPVDRNPRSRNQDHNRNANSNLNSNANNNLNRNANKNVNNNANANEDDDEDESDYES